MKVFFVVVECVDRYYFLQFKNYQLKNNSSIKLFTLKMSVLLDKFSR